MNHRVVRFVSALLVPALIAADPAWASIALNKPATVYRTIRVQNLTESQALNLISPFFTPNHLWTQTPVYVSPFLMASFLPESEERLPRRSSSHGSPAPLPADSRNPAVERALKYAAVYDGKDFVSGFYSPKSWAEIRAYLYLMNFPMPLLLERLQTAEPQTEDYRRLLTALAMNHRLADFHLLREQYNRWGAEGDPRCLDLLPVMRQVIYQGRLLPGGTGPYYLINQRTYPDRDAEIREPLTEAIARLKRRYPEEHMTMQDWAAGDGTLSKGFQDYLNSKGVQGLTIDAYDKSLGFKVVRRLFPSEHRFGGYTFVFDAEGKVTQSLSSDQKALWVRWQLSDYLGFPVRLLFKGLIAAFAQTRVGSLGLSAKEIEEIETQYQTALVTNRLTPEDFDDVSTVSPEVVAAVRHPGDGVRLTIKQADIFKRPQATPEKSVHVIRVLGLLMRNNEYFAPSDIKKALGELGRTLKEGGLLINGVRGSKQFPEKLYMDVYQRMGYQLIRLTAWPGAYDDNEGWNELPIAGTPQGLPPSSGPGGSTRREWLKNTSFGFGALFLLLKLKGLIWPQTVHAASSPEDARRYENLLPRLIETSPALRSALEKIRAAQDHLEAATSRNVSISITQNDLTRSPRVPLGNSAQTPGPFKPIIKDVIARSELDIQGARQKVESLQPKRTGFWNQVTEGLKTLFVRGGWQINSDSIVLLSRQEAYEAGIDLNMADAEAFKILEEEWQGQKGQPGLQDSWFDLAIKEVEIRRLETLKRAKEKEIAAHDQRLNANYADASGKLDLNRVPPAEQIVRLTLTAASEGLERDLVLRRNELKALASQTVFQGLTSQDKAAAAASDQYRALPPPVQPTLSFIEQILVSSDRVPDRKKARDFRTALAKRLPKNAVPQDPYSPESRALVLDNAWEVKGSRPSIAASDIERDTGYTLSLEETNRLLEIPQENLLRQAKQSPEQAKLIFGIQRFWEVIDTLHLTELRQWTFRIFGKLGLDLPIQIASHNEQPVESDRTEFLIQEKKDLIASTQALLDKAYDTNDKDVKTARDTLASKLEVLVQLAEQSYNKIGEMTVLMENQITEPAMQFEDLVFKFEMAALELEKSYQRLHYLIDGRAELRHLLDQKRDAYLASKPSQPAAPPAVPPTDRRDHSIPTRDKAPKAHAGLSRPSQVTLTGLAVSAVAAAGPLDGPLFQPGSVPDYLQWALIGGLMLWALAFPHLPHLLSGGSKDRPNALRRWLLFFALSITILFPGNVLWGLGLGFGTAFVSWLERPQSITRHKVFSPAYWGAFILDRKKILSRGARAIAIAVMVIYSLVPTGQSVRDTIDYLVRKFSTTTPAVQSVSIAPIRIPLFYTPIESGELVAERMPEGKKGTFSVHELVRWIGPNDSIPNDAVFVFRSRSGGDSLEDQIVRLDGDVRAAQARVETARRLSDEATLRTAQTAVTVAQSRLAAVRARLSARQEPMPADPPLQVDATLSMAPEHTAVTTGIPLVLAYQEASYSARLPLIVSPEQALGIGTGLSQPERHIRMIFELRGGGKPVIIPVQAIQQLSPSTEGESGLSALSRDSAKGGFAQFHFDAAILITDDMLKVPGLVPQETLDFLSSLNDIDPAALPQLDLTGFDELRGTRKVPFRESLEDNEVVGLAELQATAAPAAQTSVPQETAVRDVGALQSQIEAEKAAEQDLNHRLGLLPRGDAASEEDRRKISSALADTQARIKNLESQTQNTRPSIRMTAEQGVSIGPRQLETVKGGIWTFARYRFARIVNPWSQKNPSRGPAQNSVIKRAVNWDGQALDQVRDGAAQIVIRSALKSPEQLSLPQWEIQFPGEKDPIIYDKTLETSTPDPVMGLARITITKAFSITDAQRLVRLPGSVLPVKIRLPASPMPPAPIPSGSRNAIMGLLAAGLALISIRAIIKARRRRNSAQAAVAAENRETDHFPSYVTTDKRIEPRKLKSMDISSINTLSRLFRTTYFSYEHRDDSGRELNEEDIEKIQFGHTGLEPQEAKTLVDWFHFQNKRDNPNKKTWQSTGIWIIETLLTIPLFLSERAFETLRTAYLGGTPLLEILRTLLLSRDWSGTFNLHTLLTNPTAFLDFYPFFVFITVLWLIIYQVSKNLIEKIGGTWSQLRTFWFKRIKKVDVIRKKFLATTAEISPDGAGLRPMMAAARIRKDPEGIDDPETALPLQNPETFMDILREFGRMLSLRASQTLLASAKEYMNESPEKLDEMGTTLDASDLDTETTLGNKKKASDARWWATILREIARYQGTPQSLIPPGTPLDQDHIQFQEKYLEIIATNFLGMNLATIEARLHERIQNPVEVKKRLERIHAEYMDRALVYWAIEEMRSRPISTFVALETFDLTGLAMRDTGKASADRRFGERKGNIENVLKEFRLRLPTLSKRAHQLRSEYSRQTRMFQMIHYLSMGFSKNDRLNPTLQNTVRRLVIDPKTQRTIIRERSEYGVPTFEALAFEYYLTGIWPQHLQDEIRVALQARRGFSPEKAATEVAKIKTTLERENTRIYMAWLVARRMLKDVPDNFDELLLALRYTENRDAFDMRFLSDPAPIMDANKENHATNADILMANLRDENLLQELMGTAGEPIFGDVDIFGDPALEINLREAAVDLGIMAQTVGGRVHLTALSSALDPFIDQLSERVTTRLPGPENRRVHVLTYAQTDALLPTAGERKENSIFVTALDPGNLTRVVDPDRTGSNLYIIAPPSPYLKFAMLLLYFSEVSIDRERIFEKLTPEKQAYFKARLADIRPQLERMNVRVRISPKWNEDIMTKEAPSDIDDNSYNTGHIIFAMARRLKSAPTTDAIFPLDPKRAVMTETEELPVDATRTLRQTRWGEGGKGAIYRVLDGVVIPTLEKGFFLLHDEYKRLLAMRYFHKHEININGIDTPAIYHSWTTTAGSVRRKGMATELSKRTLEEFKKKLHGKGIAIANVEIDNASSWKRLEQQKYLQVGQFVTGLFSSLKPKASTNMRPAKAADKYRILELLQRTYKDHLFTDFDPVTFDLEGHYVWEEDGQILAVINAKKQHWAIERLKFKGDAPLIWLFKKTKGLKKMFNLGDFWFLKLGNIAYAPGEAGKAVQLIEAAMADKGVYDALGYFDKKSPVYVELKNANAFGSVGGFNLVQETKIRVYAYAFDPENAAVISALNQDYKNKTGQPAYYAYKNLMWWLAPLAAASAILYNLIHPVAAAAATLPILQKVAEQTTSAALQVPAPAGSSPAWFAEHFPGVGSHMLRLQDWLAANPQWAEAAKAAKKAGAKLTENYLFHPGDMVNVPGQVIQTAIQHLDTLRSASHSLPLPPMPALPAIDMVQSPFSGLIHLAAHPIEILYILATVAFVGLLMGAGVGIAQWLWNRLKNGQFFIRPVLGGGLAVAALAGQNGDFKTAQPTPGSGKPSAAASPKRSSKTRRPTATRAPTAQKEKQATPVPAPLVKPIEEIIVPDAVEIPAPPAWTMDPEARVVGGLTPEAAERQSQLNQPPAPLPVDKKDKKAVKEFIAYVNVQLSEAKAAQEAIPKVPAPLAQAAHRIAAGDTAMLKELQALLQEWKASVAPGDLSSDDAQALDHLAAQLAHLEGEAAAALDEASGNSKDIVPEVEQLRMEYLAIYAQRKGEIPEKPLQASVPQKPTGKRGILDRLLSRLKGLAGPAKTLGTKAGKPLGVLPGNEAVHPMDPAVDALRKRAEDLIRTAKRNQILAHRLLKMAEDTAQKTPEPSSAKPEGTEERLAWIKARFEYVESARQLAMYREATKAADQRAENVRLALEESQDVGNPAEPDRFENVLNTTALWAATPAAPSQLADDLEKVQTTAAKGIVPVKGTETMTSRQRRETLEIKVEQAGQIAMAADIQTDAAQAGVDEQLALAQQLQHLGLEREANEIQRQAVLSARESELLPTDSPIYRESQRTVTLENGPSLATRRPELSKALRPILERAEKAAATFQATADKTAALESDWIWKSKTAKSRGFDPLLLFSEDRAPLVRALQEEADARAALKAAELALSVAESRNPGLVTVKKGPLLTAAKIAAPDDQALESIERTVLARGYSLAILHTAIGKHAQLLAAFWLDLPWPADEWKDFTSLVDAAQRSMPAPKNTRAARLSSWLTQATWVKGQLIARNMTPGLAIGNHVSLIPPTVNQPAASGTVRKFQAPPPVQPATPAPFVLPEVPPSSFRGSAAAGIPTMPAGPTVFPPAPATASEVYATILRALRNVSGPERLAPWYGITERDSNTRPKLAAELEPQYQALAQTVKVAVTEAFASMQAGLTAELAVTISHVTGIKEMASEADRRHVRNTAFETAWKIQNHPGFDSRKAYDDLRTISDGKVTLRMTVRDGNLVDAAAEVILEVLFPSAPPTAAKTSEPAISPAAAASPTPLVTTPTPTRSVPVPAAPTSTLDEILSSSPAAAKAYANIEKWFKGDLSDWLIEHYNGTHADNPLYTDGPIHLPLMDKTFDLMAQALGVNSGTVRLRASFQVTTLKLAYHLENDFAGDLSALNQALDRLLGDLKQNPSLLNDLMPKEGDPNERMSGAIEKVIHNRIPLSPKASAVPSSDRRLARAA